MSKSFFRFRDPFRTKVSSLPTCPISRRTVDSEGMKNGGRACRSRSLCESGFFMKKGLSARGSPEVERSEIYSAERSFIPRMICQKRRKTRDDLPRNLSIGRQKEV